MLAEVAIEPLFFAYQRRHVDQHPKKADKRERFGLPNTRRGNLSGNSIQKTGSLYKIVNFETE